MYDYFIKLVQFPKGKTHEAVTENEDGSHTIFVDSNLSHDKQKSCALHAICHINNCDFEKTDVQNIENVVHEIMLNTGEY